MYSKECIYCCATDLAGVSLAGIKALITRTDTQQTQISSLNQALIANSELSQAAEVQSLTSGLEDLNNRVLSLESILDQQASEAAFMQTLTTTTTIPAQHIVTSLDNTSVSLATISDRDGIAGISTSEANESEKASIQDAGITTVVVTNENGSIKRGDPITVSSVKDGFGTRAVTDGMIVGFALEDAVYEATASGSIETNPTPTLPPDSIATDSAEATPSAEPANTSEGNLQTGQVKIAVSVLWHGEPQTFAGLMEQSTSLTLNEDIVTFDQPVAIYNDLNVLGRTVVDTLTATGDIRAGLLTINSSEQSINTIGEPLKLQNHLTAGNIDIFDGKVLMTTNGDIKTIGEITAKKYNVDTEDVAGASAGSITIPAGEDFAIVETTALTPNSLIFVTPERAEAVGSYKYDETTIVIELKAPLSEDLNVNWWIIN